MNIAAFIDHTLLKADATADQIRQLCAEARAHEFAAVCVNPCRVALSAKELRGSGVEVCTVAGFPLGATRSEQKAVEALRAVEDGAREIDMVLNVGALRDGDADAVRRDIEAVVIACSGGGAFVKVIIEAALLTDDEKRTACELAHRAGAKFVKTSTGFGPGGATAHDVVLMAAAVSGTGMGVKAAGGIKTYNDAKTMIDAGATRIGTSSGTEIVGGQGP